jgi:predicted RNA-binding protein YlqC (UPF0109 family)
MQRSKRQIATRNKLDMADLGQVRILKKRLRVSDEDMARIVAKTGNSISAISKEIEIQKAAHKLTVEETAVGATTTVVETSVTYPLAKALAIK